MVRESRFRNPEFQEKLARARRYERKTGLYFSWRSFIILGLFLTAVYFLAISKKFLVTQAAVSGTGASAEEISAVLTRMRNERFGYVIPRNHILILDEEKLLFEIQQEFPAVRSISALKKIWPDQIAVAIEERVPKYVWQSGSDFYLLDQDGVVFQAIASYAPETFSQALIIDTSAAPVTAGEGLSIKPILEFVSRAKDAWQTHINQAGLVHFSVPGGKSQDILVKTTIGFNVLFDLERDPVEQLENLKILLNREILPETHGGLSYIDLRLPHMAYYCYKDAPCAPEYATSTQPSI